LLKGIITEAAHVFVEPETISGIRAADDAFDRCKLSGLVKYHGKKTSVIFKAWSLTWLSAWFRHWSLEYLLPSIDCPLLAIQGRDDQYGTEAQVALIASKVGGVTHSILLDDCGHSPHTERPTRVLEVMSEFIEHDVLAASR
jgi:pimeloyl-ACP methyl ester carboxylesterase